MVLGQRRVDEKCNEISAAPTLPAGCNLSDTVTIMDTLLTQRDLAQQILQQRRHYLMVVKGTNPIGAH
jgi:predicted transposase YbfD/YdcC